MKKRKWIIGFLCIIFILLIVFIKTGVIKEFDNFCYNIVTHNMSEGLTTFHKAITFLGSTVFIVVLSLLLFIIFWILKKKNKSYIVASVIIISTLFNVILKNIIRRARPDVLKLVIEKSFSFPSGHTMAIVSLYGILWYIVLKSKLSKNIKIILSIILGILPIMVAISRIYLGAHFASDVIGGFILSSILLLIETYYCDFFSKMSLHTFWILCKNVSITEQ